MQARSMRLTWIQAAPWRFPGFSGRTRALDPRPGYSSGDRRNNRQGLSRTPSSRFIPGDEGDRGESAGTIFSRGPGSEETGYLKRIFPGRSRSLSESLPGEGKRRKVVRPSVPWFPMCIRRCRPITSVDPRSHPIPCIPFPKERNKGSWVEPWNYLAFRCPSRRMDMVKGSVLPRVRSACRCVSSLFAEAWGNLCSVRIPFRGSFPKASPPTTPKGGQGSGVEDRRKGQIQ